MNAISVNWFLAAGLGLYAATVLPAAVRKFSVQREAHASRWGASRSGIVLVLFMLANLSAFAAAAPVRALVGLQDTPCNTFAVLVVLTYVLNLATLVVLRKLASTDDGLLVALGLSPLQVRETLKSGVLLFVSFLPVQVLFPVLVDRAYEYLTGKAPPVQEAVTVLLDADLPVLVVTASAACLLAPLLEEIVFRGFIQRGLEKSAGRVAGIALTALLFSAAHGVPDLAVKVLPLGFVLSAAYGRSRNLAANIVFHGLFNATGVLAALAVRYVGLDLTP